MEEDLKLNLFLQKSYSILRGNVVKYFFNPEGMEQQK